MVHLFSLLRNLDMEETKAHELHSDIGKDGGIWVTCSPHNHTSGSIQIPYDQR